MSETKKSKKKGKKGTGYVEILPSGAVRIKPTVEGIDGIKRPKSFTGKTLKEAEEKRDAYRDALKDAKEEGEFYFKRFEDAVNIWLYQSKAVDLSEASLKRLKSTFYVNILPDLGKTELHKIDSSKLQILLNKRICDLSYSSVKKIFDGLNNFYKWAVTTNRIGFNRMAGVVLPKQKHFSIKTKEIQIIPDEKIDRLVEVALSRHSNGKLKYRSGPAIVLLLLTGLRLGELLALEWSDVDFETRELKVWKTLIEKDLDERDPTLTPAQRIMHENGKKSVFLIQFEPKSEASNRVLKLNKRALEMLNLLRNDDCKYIVGTLNGNFRLPSNFERTFKLVLSEAGICEMGVHCTRHTFATRMIRKKVPLRVISKILGHASEKVTRDIYIHVCPDELKDAYMVAEELYDF
ncbi:MAG TPA: site-specific integrase [Anaerovoracaceae bacterium]|nr:site-specific integrase [Anaerovoracaceae bacterium]